MAHPDDAEILCAGTLIRLAGLGWEVHIATMTAGDCGSATLSAEAAAALRKAEAARSAGLVGAHYRCLEEHDGFVMYDKPTLRKVVDLMRTVAPGIVISHAPSDYMMDHEQTSLLARGASFLFAAPNASAIPPVSGLRVPHLYFTDPLEGRAPSGHVAGATTVIRIAKELRKKIEMLSCHKSQFEWMEHHNQSGDLARMVERHAIDRGRLIGAVAAEAFDQFLGHGYPSDDLLRDLLSGSLEIVTEQEFHTGRPRRTRQSDRPSGDDGLLPARD